MFLLCLNSLFLRRITHQTVMKHQRFISRQVWCSSFVFYITSAPETHCGHHQNFSKHSLELCILRMFQRFVCYSGLMKSQQFISLWSYSLFTSFRVWLFLAQRVWVETYLGVSQTGSQCGISSVFCWWTVFSMCLPIPAHILLFCCWRLMLSHIQIQIILCRILLLCNSSSLIGRHTICIQYGQNSFPLKKDSLIL